MGPFRVVVWCKACQDDEEGCFGGGTEVIGSRFETRAEAEKAAIEYCRGFPYSFRIERDLGVETSDVGSTAWASELGTWLAK